MFKRSVFIFNFIILTTLCSWAQVFTEKESILVNTFPKGSGNGELGYFPQMGGGNPYPSTFCFDDDKNFYIPDPVNIRLCVFNSKFELLKTIKFASVIDPGALKIDSEGNFIGYYGSWGIQKMSSSGEELFSIFLMGEDIEDELRGDGLFLIDSNLVFAYKKDGGLIGYNNPGPDYKENNRNVITDTAEVVRTIQQNHPSLRVEKETPVVKQSVSRTEAPQRSSSSEGGDQVYQNGELLSRSFEDFEQKNELNYNTLSMSRSSSSDTTDIYQLLEEKLKKQTRILLGTDSDGNTYWQIHYTYFIFNSSGIPIAAIEIDPEFKTAGTVITPSGDVFYMHSDKTGHYLYKIERDW